MRVESYASSQEGPIAVVPGLTMQRARDRRVYPGGNAMVTVATQGRPREGGIPAGPLASGQSLMTAMRTPVMATKVVMVHMKWVSSRLCSAWICAPKERLVSSMR